MMIDKRQARQFTQRALAAFILGGFIQAVAHSATKNYVCPQSIPETSVRLLAPGPEWTPFVSSPLYLSGAAPADGPPERLGILRASDSRVETTGMTWKYSLDGRYAEGKWLRCDYGAFGEISLARRLPDDVQECTIIRRKGAHAGESQIEIRCQ